MHADPSVIGLFITPDKSAHEAVRRGRFLSNVKRSMPHAQWVPWLRASGIRQRTANDLVRIATAAAEIPALVELTQRRLSVVAALRGPSLESFVNTHGIQALCTMPRDALRTLVRGAATCQPADGADQ